jgi:hypothetical protein
MRTPAKVIVSDPLEQDSSRNLRIKQNEDSKLAMALVSENLSPGKTENIT